MKPHLALHITPKGEWWISKHTQVDKGYTLASTLNYRTPAGAIRAAKFLWENSADTIRVQSVTYAPGWTPGTVGA